MIDENETPAEVAASGPATQGQLLRTYMKAVTPTAAELAARDASRKDPSGEMRKLRHLLPSELATRLQVLGQAYVTKEVVRDWLDDKAAIHDVAAVAKALDLGDRKKVPLGQARMALEEKLAAQPAGVLEASAAEPQTAPVDSGVAGEMRERDATRMAAYRVENRAAAGVAAAPAEETFAAAPAEGATQEARPSNAAQILADMRAKKDEATTPAVESAATPVVEAVEEPFVALPVTETPRVPTQKAVIEAGLKAKNLSNREAADLAGIEVTKISGWKVGKAIAEKDLDKPDSDIGKLATALGDLDFIENLRAAAQQAARDAEAENAIKISAERLTSTRKRIGKALDALLASVPPTDGEREARQRSKDRSGLLKQELADRTGIDIERVRALSAGSAGPDAEEFTAIVNATQNEDNSAQVQAFTQAVTTYNELASAQHTTQVAASRTSGPKQRSA